MKHQGSVGRRIDLRRVRSAGNVCAADKQWMVTKGVGDLNPYFCPASAGVHDEPQSLVPEALDMPWHGGLRGRRPRSDPPFAGRILRHRQHGQQSNEAASKGIR